MNGFILATFETFDDMSPSSEIGSKDHDFKLFSMLRDSKSPVTEFLSSFYKVSPTVWLLRGPCQRITQASLTEECQWSQETINDRLQIYWNSVSTSKYDPRPAIQTFLLQKKQAEGVARRSSLPRFYGLSFVLLDVNYSICWEYFFSSRKEKSLYSRVLNCIWFRKIPLDPIFLSSPWIL